MEGTFRENYSFIGQWYDNQSCIIRKFHIFFYPFDDTVEMFDYVSKKIFLRRNKVSGVKLENFYIGGTLYILGRLVKIIDFGCENTKQKLISHIQVTFLLIKPIPTNIAGKIITHIQHNGLQIGKMKMAQLAIDDVTYLFRHFVSSPVYPFLLEYMTTGSVYGLVLIGTDSTNKLKEIIGHENPLKADPGTIRALYGSDELRNCVYYSKDYETALEDMEYFFPPPPLSETRLRLTATLSNCTLCIIKPHAVREGKLGLALELIHEGGFDITALNMLVVEKINACEFYEVYKGIVPEYKGMVEELASGPTLAMELVCMDKTLNTPIEFRKLVGPSDPEIARLLRPNTLRAKLGNNKIQNAIHCSDLPEDGLLEVEYFFKILEL